MAAINDILRYSLEGLLNGQDVFNLIFHYRVISGSETNYNTITNAISSALSSALGNIESRLSIDVNGTVCNLWEYDFGSSEFDGKATGTHTALVGTATGDMLPNGISVVMRFATEELRRQARKFIPGVTEASVADNVVTSAVVSDFVTCAALLNDDIIAGGCTIRPCTFNTDSTSPRFETSSDFVQTAFVNTLVGYQRRRQPGAGS